MAVSYSKADKRELKKLNEFYVFCISWEIYEFSNVTSNFHYFGC